MITKECYKCNKTEDLQFLTYDYGYGYRCYKCPPSISEIFEKIRQTYKSIAAIGHIPEGGGTELLNHNLELMEYFYKLELWNESSNILDIGCGNGAYAAALIDKPNTKYLGIDVVSDSIKFCQQTYKEYKHLRFKHIDVKNELYNPYGTINGSDFAIEGPPRTYDLVIFASIFTHISDSKVIRNYLREATYHLKLRGKCITSWFRSPPNEVSNKSDRVVHLESDIINMIGESGLSVVMTNGGFNTEYHNQWQIILEKSIARTI